MADRTTVLIFNLICSDNGILEELRSKIGNEVKIEDQRVYTRDYLMGLAGKFNERVLEEIWLLIMELHLSKKFMKGFARRLIHKSEAKCTMGGIGLVEQGFWIVGK